ncbi:hypothetical protein [Streptomyces tremellae]|uniref:Uncharacterized protein n=1 Tax=Streptomyces tremellae TaxID=1124239 RepID=A0ABP7F7I0_9ACTN
MTRKEDQVRRMLEGPHPRVPPGLAPAAAARGARIVRHRRVRRLAAVLTLAAAVAALAVWLALTGPWAAPPSVVAPPPRVF